MRKSSNAAFIGREQFLFAVFFEGNDLTRLMLVVCDLTNVLLCGLRHISHLHQRDCFRGRIDCVGVSVIYEALAVLVMCLEELGERATREEVQVMTAV